MSNRMEPDPTNNTQKISRVSEAHEATSSGDIDDFIQVTRSSLENYYDNSKSADEHVEAITKRMQAFFDRTDDRIISSSTKKEFLEKIMASSSLQDKDEFIDTVLRAFEPIFIARSNHLEEFEKIQQQEMNEGLDLTEVNRLLSYKVSGSVLRLHAPAGTTVDNKVSLYRNGMHQIAKIVKDTDSIQEIKATSFLVTEHASLFSRMGFSIGDISDEDREEYFPHEQREIKEATISREDFLQKYLAEQ